MHHAKAQSNARKRKPGLTRLLLLIRLFQQTPTNCGWGWISPPHPVSARSVSVCGRFQGRAAFGTTPLATVCDYDERRIHPDRPGVGRGLRRDVYQPATAAGCQLPGLPGAPPILLLSAVRSAEVGGAARA